MWIVFCLSVFFLLSWLSKEGWEASNKIASIMYAVAAIFWILWAIRFNGSKTSPALKVTQTQASWIVIPILFVLVSSAIGTIIGFWLKHYSFAAIAGSLLAIAVVGFIGVLTLTDPPEKPLKDF